MDTDISKGGAEGSRAVAERWLGIAERLLAARDLMGSKRFAERALELDPLLDSDDAVADRIIAVADVLLASQSRRVAGGPDWYAILQLDHSPPPPPSAVRRQYRRLALLLGHESRAAPLPCADSAYKLVSDAWAVLSDPAQKARFDADVNRSAAKQPVEPPGQVLSGSVFWTGCPTCWLVHQYDRAYAGRTLRCPNCRRAFTAAELAVPPTIVPGTEMYYCSWGFFPLGLSSGPQFPPPGPPNGPAGDIEPPGHAEEPVPPRSVPPVQSRSLKKVAAKRVGGSGGFRNTEHASHNMGPEEGNQMRPMVIDINEDIDIDINQEVGGCLEAEHVDIGSFDIEIDMDHLPHLSFFKEDDIKIH